MLNASPIIVLARIGYEHLLYDIPEQVLVPRAVADEVMAGPEGDSARAAMKAGHFPIQAAVPLVPEVMAWDLGRGETAVLSYALANPGWTVILDDGAAPRCARSYSLPIKGTLAIVLLAKQRGLIASATDLLLALRAAGMHLDDATIRAALLRTVGEEWV